MSLPGIQTSNLQEKCGNPWVVSYNVELSSIALVDDMGGYQRLGIISTLLHEAVHCFLDSYACYNCRTKLFNSVAGEHGRPFQIIAERLEDAVPRLLGIPVKLGRYESSVHGWSKVRRLPSRHDMVMFKFSNVKLASSKDEDIGKLLECTHNLLHHALPLKSLRYLEYGGQELMYRGFFERLPDNWDACSPNGKVRWYMGKNIKGKEKEGEDISPKDEEDAAKKSEDIQEESQTQEKASGMQSPEVETAVKTLPEEKEKAEKRCSQGDVQVVGTEVKTSSKTPPNNEGKANKTLRNDEAQSREKCGECDVQDACTKPPPASATKVEHTVTLDTAPASTDASETQSIDTLYFDAEDGNTDATSPTEKDESNRAANPVAKPKPICCSCE